MNRPVGVILSAVVLGFGALFLIAIALITLLGTLLGPHVPNPAAPQASAGLIAAMGVVMSFVYLALSGWAIATIIGLVRLRPWSRISIMIIGGGVAVISFFTALMCVAMPTLMASMPMPPNANPHAIRGIFFVMAVVFLFISAIGVWWLAYFAMRKIRTAFQLSTQSPYLDSAAPPPYPQDEYSFNTAQQTASAKRQANGNIRPVSITILAVLFALCGTMLVATIFLPQPLMVFGFLLHGKASIVAKLLMSCWTVAAAIGLFKLEKPAWYLATAYCGFCILNSLWMLLPGGRERMHAYMLEVMASNPMAPAVQMDPFKGPFFHLIMIPGVIFGFVILAFSVVLLWRARWAFGLTPQSDHAAA